MCHLYSSTTGILPTCLFEGRILRFKNCEVSPYGHVFPFVIKKRSIVIQHYATVQHLRVGHDAHPARVGPCLAQIRREPLSSRGRAVLVLSSAACTELGAGLACRARPQTSVKRGAWADGRASSHAAGNHVRTDSARFSPARTGPPRHVNLESPSRQRQSLSGPLKDFLKGLRPPWACGVCLERE